MSDEEELNIDESMAKTLEEIEGRDENEDEQQAEAPSDNKPEELETDDGADDTEDNSGESVEETVSEESAEEGSGEEVSGEEGSEEESEDLGAPPAAYSAAAKDDWAKTPKSVREAAIKREIDSSNGIQPLKEKADFGTRLSQAANPYMGMIQARGGTLEQFIIGQGNTMNGLQNGTQEQKIGILRGMAGLAGIDIANIQPPSEVERQLSPYMQKIDQLQSQINRQNQAVTSQEDLSINQALTAFETETDENGLTHPYFHNVESEMVQAIPIIRQNNPHFSHAEVLQQAYDNSIWANPETRQQIQVQQDRKAEQERKRKAKETAAKAKKANKVNLGKKGQHDSSQAEPLGSIDDTMAAIVKDIKSR